ncbi:MAG: DUF5131 family protein [Roseibacillus sp.]
MSKTTSIQWCDSTVNLAMGCDGCELWPTRARLTGDLVQALEKFSEAGKESIKSKVDAAFGESNSVVILWLRREDILMSLWKEYPAASVWVLRDTFERGFRCYAGFLHLMRGASLSDLSKAAVKGYAANFDRPEMFPGRMKDTAKLKNLTGQLREGKPWLDGLPRLIFVSDMGDALSRSIPFDYLKSELINIVNTEEGRRHVWLWLTKRPHRMKEFALWLKKEHGQAWPENLMAMTSVTDQASTSRVESLLEIPCKLKGLSVEPLVGPVKLNLEGIDWVIIGGESGKHACEFNIQWARDLRMHCQESGVAFFVKQLGANPVDGGFPLFPEDGHGGDWEEWPKELRIREIPKHIVSVVSTPKKDQNKERKSYAGSK